MKPQTPRTDAAWFDWTAVCRGASPPMPAHVVPADLARQLERELAHTSAAVMVALERALNDDAEIADLRAQLAAAKEDAERLRAALGLAWILHVREKVHLGLERWSGFEQGCVACVCALALGEAIDPSPTTEEFIERRRVVKEGDAARRT